MPIPEPPAGELVAWAIKNPDAVRQAIRFLNQLETMRATIVRPGGTDRVLLIGSEGILQQLPLRFSSPVAAPSGGATVDTQCRARLAELLDRLADLGINK